MIRFFLCIGIALFIGTGCRQTPAAVEIVPATSTSLPPTATHVSTDTPQSTVTPQPTGTEPPPTATVTRTPTPKSSATPAPTSIRTDLDAAERIVADGGFAFRLFLPDLDVELQPTQALFADKKGTFLSSMGGGVEADDSDSLDIILSDILQSLNESMAAGLQAGEPYPITVGGVEGLAVDVSGTMFDGPVLGRLLAVRPYKGQIFYAFALGNTASGDERWVEDGSSYFETLLDSLRFFPIALGGEDSLTPAPAAGSDGGPCPVSVDETYGYTQENAVRVGGGAFGGPSRAIAYLDTLQGPAGEAVTYHRIGSMPFEDTILDSYEVSYEGSAQPAVLFVDQYAFETLYAPVGFTCKIPFPLTAP